MQVWDARSGTRLLTYRTMLSPSFRAVAWSPNGTRIATGSVGHLDDLGTPVAQVWDATAATLLLTYRGQNADISDLAFSPDSSRVASASQDGTVQVWDARTGNALLIYRGHSGSGVNALAWSPDGSRIVSGGGIVQGGTGSGAALLWDARSGAPLYTHACRFPVNAGAFSPDGSRIASDDGNQSIIIWSAGGSLGPAGTTLLTYTGHASSDAGKPVANGIESIAWSPDGSRIASADGYGTVRIWDARSGTTMLVYRGHSAAVFAAAWSPDGSRIASASEDTTVQVWQA
jgi:WD40 repeat protein